SLFERGPGSSLGHPGDRRQIWNDRRPGAADGYSSLRRIGSGWPWGIDGEYTFGPFRPGADDSGSASASSIPAGTTPARSTSPELGERNPHAGVARPVHPAPTCPTGNFYQRVIRSSALYRTPNRCARLELLHPVFRRKLLAVMADLKHHGIDAVVYETYRSQVRQTALYRSGASQLKTVGEHHFGVAADVVF